MPVKIILANFPLTRGERKKLKNETDNKYSIKTIDEIENSELKYVESMLVDPQQKNPREFLSQKMFRQMPDLKFIQCVFAGVDWMNFEQIPENVVVSGNVGAYASAMAEHIMGMILFFAKDFVGHHQRLKLGLFENRYSIQLNDKIIGIIGAGGIGQAVAKLAKCFGMYTVGVNTSGTHVPHFDSVVPNRKLDSVLRRSDFVVLSIPLTVKTFHIINRKKLSLMKKNCILVNIARGYIINEKDLYTHLKQNPTFKFANDVWWRYPKTDEQFAQNFPFLELPNFLGTPHNSGFVPGREHLAVTEAIENLAKFAKKQKFKGLVNRGDYLGLKNLIR